MSELVQLTASECLSLLASHVVGRVAVCAPAGPRLVPVNYTVHENALFFRTGPLTLMGTFAWGNEVAFEIDDIDLERRRGWSVVATGRAQLVEDSEELRTIRNRWNPEPWAPGDRDQYVKLEWRELTGRRIAD